VPEGFCGPSHALAFGKVLIADGGSAAIDRYIHRYELRAFTERTITDPVRLEAHLKAVSRCGYALDQEEFAKNLYFVAVGVRDAGGAVCGSVALATLSSSPPPDLPRMIGLARCGADRISQGLCGEPRPHVPVALR
jgi:DNA-binding IclR family transcriptional regulator